MFNKWVVATTLSLSLLSVTAIGADRNEITSYTTTIKHSHGGGGRGVDNIRLMAPKTKSDHCAMFKSAEIKYSMRRYAHASIVSLPSLHCNLHKKTSCNVDIAWKHAPAGGLNYHVKVEWSLQTC